MSEHIEPFEVEVLFSDGDEAEAMVAAVSALGHKVECNSVVFVPSCQGTRQPGDAEWLSYSIEIAQAHDHEHSEEAADNAQAVLHAIQRMRGFRGDAIREGGEAFHKLTALPPALLESLCTMAGAVIAAAERDWSKEETAVAAALGGHHGRN